MKLFREEIQRFFNKLARREPFAFSKYADGEWMAINRHHGSPGNGEWEINDHSELSSRLLTDSFVFKDPGYYVGISCPCCQGINHYLMKHASKQDDEHLTFANLFVNANYQYFLDNFIEEFTNHSVVLVANNNCYSQIKNLPFNVNQFFGVSYNAWINDLSLIDIMKNINYQNQLILFSCGPLGNILAHQLWAHNKNNIYLDVGSTVDRWLNNDVKNKRWYATGVVGYADRVCVWEDNNV